MNCSIKLEFLPLKRALVEKSDSWHCCQVEWIRGVIKWNQAAFEIEFKFSMLNFFFIQFAACVFIARFIIHVLVKWHFFVENEEGGENWNPRQRSIIPIKTGLLHYVINFICDYLSDRRCLISSKQFCELFVIFFMGVYEERAGIMESQEKR